MKLKRIVIAVVINVAVALSASAEPVSLRFTEEQMPLGTNSSVVELSGNEYQSFGILMDGVYRYFDVRDPFGDAPRDGGFGLSMCAAYQSCGSDRSLAEIDFVNPVSNLAVDWWTVTGAMTLDVYNSSNVLTSSFSGSGAGTFVVPMTDISRFTFRDSGGYIAVSNIRFDSNVTPVPEPASMLLLGSGLVGVGVRRWRRQARA